MPLVFVVDSDKSVRDSLRQLIHSSGWEPDTLESAEELLARPRPVVPSCLILDASLLTTNAPELQKLLVAEWPSLPVIVISACGDVSTIVQAMKAGAIDFLEKPIHNEILLDAIQKGLELSRAALQHDSELRHLRIVYSSLSPRERQVMKLVVSGLSNKQVGHELRISEITVKAHRGQVMQKMGAKSLPDLVMMATQLNLTLSENVAHDQRASFPRPTPLQSRQWASSRMTLQR